MSIVTTLSRARVGRLAAGGLAAAVLLAAAPTGSRATPAATSCKRTSSKQAFAAMLGELRALDRDYTAGKRSAARIQLGCAERNFGVASRHAVAREVREGSHL